MMKWFFDRFTNLVDWLLTLAVWLGAAWLAYRIWKGRGIAGPATLRLLAEDHARAQEAYDAFEAVFTAGGSIELRAKLREE